MDQIDWGIQLRISSKPLPFQRRRAVWAPSFSSGRMISTRPSPKMSPTATACERVVCWSAGISDVTVRDTFRCPG